MHMKLKSIKIKELERAWEKSIIWFFAYPNTRMGLTELSKVIKSSKTATKEAVNTLIKQEFLHKEVVGRSWILSAHQKHNYFKTKKIAYHLDKIYEVGIVDVVYKTIPQARAITLFGSYRWGSDTENSDIDIAVEVLGNDDLQITCLGVIAQFGYRKNVPVNLHIFSRNKIDLNLFANIANGIVLDGFLEVRP